MEQGRIKTPGLAGLTIVGLSDLISACSSKNCRVQSYFPPSAKGKLLWRARGSLTGRSLARSTSFYPCLALRPHAARKRYLSDEHDLRVLINTTRLALRIARAEPLSSVLDLPLDSRDESTFFWPGDADPDTGSVFPSHRAPLRTLNEV